MKFSKCSFYTAYAGNNNIEHNLLKTFYAYIIITGDYFCYFSYYYKKKKNCTVRIMINKQ